MKPESWSLVVSKGGERRVNILRRVHEGRITIPSSDRNDCPRKLLFTNDIKSKHKFSHYLIIVNFNLSLRYNNRL